MKDHELLEFAAKAAGFEVSVNDIGGCWRNDGSRIWPKWNPLDNDGDALRLAVKLDLSLFRLGSYPAAQVRTDDGETFFSDTCIRRAIVSAAAEIGKSMP